MRDAYNSELYGPLQDEFVKGRQAGTDFWIHKNRYVQEVLAGQHMYLISSFIVIMKYEWYMGLPNRIGLVPQGEWNHYFAFVWSQH